MPEFPNQFTAATTVLPTDYVFVNQTKATVAQLGQAIGSSSLAEWNGVDVSQFSAAQTFGAPVAPSISYIAAGSNYSGVVRLRLSAGSPAGSGAIYWLPDEVDFQSLNVHFSVSVNTADPIQVGDELAVGVTVAGDATVGSGVSCMIAANGAGGVGMYISGSDAYGSSAFLQTTVLPGLTYSIVDWRFNASLTDAAGFPPNGVPAMGGYATVMDVANGFTAVPTTFTAAAGWGAPVGAAESNRVGILVLTTTGLASPASLDLGAICFTRNSIGTP